MLSRSGGWSVLATVQRKCAVSIRPWEHVVKVGGGTPVAADRLSRAARSELMSRVRSRDTAPERAARRLLTDMGYRYRLHYGRLPGSPDIAFPGRRKAIWVHGCFWHQHPNCPKAALPESRREFWVPKLESNRNRDLTVEAEAQRRGWATFVLWECELKEPLQVADRLRRFLDESH